MSNPYSALPATSFWRSAVAEKHPLDIASLWTPKHDIPRDDRIVTAGSCFAQHIGKALSARGYNWFDAEPAPTFVSDALKRKFNYGIFSFRTGNIYTAALFRQWIGWALLDETPPDEAWEENGRWFDPFRPAIEPDGFASRDEMLASRTSTLDAIRRAIRQSRLVVFTLGLTEGWLNTVGGHVYPMCPGTLRGKFDPGSHVLKNYKYPEIRKDLADALNIIKGANKHMRFLLTVSPVPLTATATPQHVLTATTYSKSTLRAVAGDLAERADADYFPSYEIITGFPYRGMFFEPNMRSVSPHGVNHVMNSFFECLKGRFPPASVGEVEIQHGKHAVQNAGQPMSQRSESDVQCEEELLSAFNSSGVV